MKNYSWYIFVKKTKEYTKTLEECHGNFFSRTINSFKPSCIEINKQFEGMANSLAWYAELYNIKGEGSNNFLNRIQEFKDYKNNAQHEGAYTLLF